jgi:hypothetical protein
VEDFSKQAAQAKKNQKNSNDGNFNAEDLNAKLASLGNE